MEQICRFILGVVAALVLCKNAQAEGNTTTIPANSAVSCGHHDNSSNCTGLKDDRKWDGHFSECPKEFRHYCLHGKCRFVNEQNTPSCRCESGYLGTRCQYLDVSPNIGEQKKILIACLVAGLVFLILLIVFICICIQKKRRKNKNRQSEEAKLRQSLSCSCRPV